MTLSDYCNDSKVIKELETNPDFKKYADTMAKTLDYLSTRYRIELACDMFTYPRTSKGNVRDHEILFKIFKTGQSQSVMWLYLVYSRIRDEAKYVSVEVDDKYIGSIKDYLSGCFKKVERSTYPNVKFEYRDFEQIKPSLITICDAIDNVINGNTDRVVTERVVVDNDINIPLRPKYRSRKNDGSIKYVCARCYASFLKASRCPECGQLVKE